MLLALIMFLHIHQIIQGLPKTQKQRSGILPVSQGANFGYGGSRGGYSAAQRFILAFEGIDRGGRARPRAG